ncbi:hypothetical protein DPMN_193443 [Dreissena polymorpha]|uniref:Uncharacterized protein n=1 Tax=Dreissena polymorpha TaxID=45954 RepID=A0A9D4BBJ0_DREPO|nr:hypothetical protein DPMN_193443 [Dreissena polymorpha]
MEFRGVLALTFHPIPCNQWKSEKKTEGGLDMGWNSIEFRGIPYNAVEFHRMSWNSIECRGIPWNAVEFHGTPWNSMERRGIP